jgi:hypothetical protein
LIRDSGLAQQKRLQLVRELDRSIRKRSERVGPTRARTGSSAFDVIAGNPGNDRDFEFRSCGFLWPSDGLDPEFDGGPIQPIKKTATRDVRLAGRKRSPGRIADQFTTKRVVYGLGVAIVRDRIEPRAFDSIQNFEGTGQARLGLEFFERKIQGFEMSPERAHRVGADNCRSDRMDRAKTRCEARELIALQWRKGFERGSVGQQVRHEMRRQKLS